MVKVFDPLKAEEALKEGRKPRRKPVPKELTRSVRHSSQPAPHKAKMVEKKAERGQPLTQRERIVADFRVFLTLVWRELLRDPVTGKPLDPSPIQLDLAHWLQHGPDRSIIMAFRGFSKSWITGAYALWRLYCDPEEKILVVSGSLTRAVATTNWCLELILRMDLLKDLRPKPSNRQSGKMFDVGNCTPAQSASFMAMGIGGQLVGFRGSCIIPDDVETQQNSLTVLMRDKNKESVKEFESVLTPGGVIKYLGTPHDLDSLYADLQKKGYVARVWPSQFPTPEEAKAYGDTLAPYITAHIRKHGPAVYGKATMPHRFPLEELAKRRTAMGNSEYQLQFMLNLSAGLTNAYPLKARDLSVMDLDDRKGPEEVSWGTNKVDNDSPPMGFDGDFYHYPNSVSPTYAPWQRVVGFIDPSGKGKDETALSIVALLYGRLYHLSLYASQDGYEEHVLREIAKRCIRFGVGRLLVEDNFGGGMFASLLKPILKDEWDKHLALLKRTGRLPRNPDTVQGTAVETVSSGRTGKERRILGVLEPILQSHRLVISRSVLREDYETIMKMDGEDGRRDFAFGYQLTHLTSEPDCLRHDDRLESLAGACAVFTDVLGIDPGGAAAGAKADRDEEELMRMLGRDDELFDLAPGTSAGKRRDDRVAAARPAKR